MRIKMTKKSNLEITKRLRTHLKEISDKYPIAWKNIDEIRQMRGKEFPAWADWCFLPMGAFYSIISAQFHSPTVPLHATPDIGVLSALGIWRISQGIYRFDETLQKSLVESPLTGEIPVEVLMRLPEWCIYVDTPEMQFLEKELHGFYCHLEEDANTKRVELRFVMDSEVGLFGFAMHLGAWTITESVDRAVKEAVKHIDSLGIKPPFDDSMDAIQRLGAEIRPLLSFLLYLCSEKPEYQGGIPSFPKPKKTKNGWRLFPPDKPKIIEVGKSLGERLREYQARESPPEGANKKPHIRRGHWHGVWSGKKDGSEERKFNYNWLPPTGVNCE